MRVVLLASCILVAQGMLASAQGVPKLNFAATCKATPATGMNRQETIDSCMNDEKDAQRALPPFWAKSTAKSRANCLAETTQGGLPSYVELLTCLQGNLLAPN